VTIWLDAENNTLRIDLAPDAKQGSWETFHESVFVRITEEGKVTGIDVLDADRILLPETLQRFASPRGDNAKRS
jgi:uncharacterized protein YuzE